MAYGFLKRLVGGILAAHIAAGGALSGEMRPFDAGQFARDQQAGKRLVIDAAADWCPTCQAQKTIIDALMAEEKYKDLVVYRLDFDTQRGKLGALGSQFQSTLIAFSGTRETARSIGDTEPASIRALFDSAVH